ncbi:FtsK/SpoIIIE domain-containing protein [Streptomyces capparidis]
MSEWLTVAGTGAPLAVAGAGAAVARVKAPSVYWATVGLPVTVARVSSSYRNVMDACGLTVQPTRLRRLIAKATDCEVLPVPPRRTGMRPTTRGLNFRLRLAPGQEPADVIAVTERLRHAWGVYSVHVVPIRPGVVELRLLGYDVLRRVRMPRRARAEFLRVPVALRDDGSAFVRDFRAIPHELVIGAGQSGKSMFQRNLISRLAPQPVAMVGIDCKLGVEMASFAPRLSALADDPDAALEVLRVLTGMEMPQRFEALREHQRVSSRVPDAEITSDIWGLPPHARPVPVIVFVDEVAELFMVASKEDEKRRDELVQHLIRLAQLSRAVGIYLEVCGQRFGSDLGKGATLLRANLTGRVCHRVNDESSAEMALGDISKAAVLAATHIRPDRPGTAVAGDVSGGWSRIRTPEISLSAATAICRKYADMIPDLPSLAPFRPVTGPVNEYTEAA